MFVLKFYEIRITLVCSITSINLFFFFQIVVFKNSNLNYTFENDNYVFSEITSTSDQLPRGRRLRWSPNIYSYLTGPNESNDIRHNC